MANHRVASVSKNNLQGILDNSNEIAAINQRLRINPSNPNILGDDSYCIGLILEREKPSDIDNSDDNHIWQNEIKLKYLFYDTQAPIGQKFKDVDVDSNLGRFTSNNFPRWDNSLAFVYFGLKQLDAFLKANQDQSDIAISTAVIYYGCFYSTDGEPIRSIYPTYKAVNNINNTSSGRYAPNTLVALPCPPDWDPIASEMGGNMEQEDIEDAKKEIEKYYERKWEGKNRSNWHKPKFNCLLKLIEWLMGIFINITRNKTDSSGLQ